MCIYTRIYHGTCGHWYHTAVTFVACTAGIRLSRACDRTPQNRAIGSAANPVSLALSDVEGQLCEYELRCQILFPNEAAAAAAAAASAAGTY